MNQRVKQISEEIRRLTPLEQAELLVVIADIVAPDEAAAIDRAWLEEAEHRLAEIDRGDVVPGPADRAIEELRSRCSRRP